LFRNLRNLMRLLRVAHILARHGALQPLINALEAVGARSAFLDLARLLFGRGMGSGRPGERLAAALAALGPAFIKLGQMLSTRTDLLGAQAAADLSTLQDRLAPFSSSIARATLEAELGRPVSELFASFDDRPVSAASIAQVHFATLPPQPAADGDPAEGSPVSGEVAVKILRPGIEHAFRRDIDLLRWLGEIIEKTQPRLRRFRPVEAIDSFARQVEFEMDLRLEAAAADELAHNFADDPTYRVPRVDWPRSARRVLTLERLTGIRMVDRATLLAAGQDIDQVLARAAAIFFKQAFRDGFFHGDQHPGNMVVDAQGRIGAVDFGIMGRLDKPTRLYLADMLLGLLERDYRRLAEIHIAAGIVPETESRDMLAQALRAIAEPVFGRPLNEISFARLLGQLFQLAETFDMQLPPHLLLLQKNMLMAEGVSRQLNPDLNIWTLAQPLIEDWMRENRGPEARIADAVENGLSFVLRLPRLIGALEKMNQVPPPRSQSLSTLSAPLGTPWWAWVLLALALGLAIFH
jgi:ubiquinone biosynthesis protein